MFDALVKGAFTVIALAFMLGAATDIASGQEVRSSVGVISGSLALIALILLWT